MTSTQNPIHPLITEAPDFFAWAGNGPQAMAILESSDNVAMHEFREAMSAAFYEVAEERTEIDADRSLYTVLDLVQDVDAEAIAAGISISTC